MTQTQFAVLCGELLLEPSIVLESDTVRQALRRKCTIEELRQILTNEF